MSDHECAEPYRECVRSRQERVRRVIETNPEATKPVLAALAGVSARTIQTVKNSTAADGEKAFSPKCTVKLRDLYDPNDITLGFQPTVRTIERALERATRAELAYVIDALIPVFEDALKRRVQNELFKAAKNAGEGVHPAA